MVQLFSLRTYGSFLLSVVFGFVCSTVAADIADDMDHRRWTASDDGPSAVGAIAQSADGYLWLGTHDSLYRFDGFDFEKFAREAAEARGSLTRRNMSRTSAFRRTSIL